MKKVYLTLLVIVTVASIIFGSLYHIGGYFRGVFRGGNTAVDEVFWVSDAQGDAAIRRIEIEGHFGDIQVQRGESTQARFRGRERNRYKAEVRGDTLFLTQSTGGAKIRVGLGDLKSESATLTLTLAEDAAPVFLAASTEMGEVRLREAGVDGCELRTQMGDVVAENCELGRAELDTDMGDVKVTDAAFTELDAYTDLGSVRIDIKQDISGFEITLETDLGSVEVNGDSLGGSFSQKGTGGKLHAATDLGDVELNSP